jgi:hypothetical protein
MPAIGTDVSGSGGPVNASDIVGVIDVANLPQIPASKLPTVIVQPKSTNNAEDNGDQLLAAYAAAKISTPHGQALSANNRATILIYPGVYEVEDGTFILDTEFVDLVGLDKKNTIIKSKWDTLQTPAIDVITHIDEQNMSETSGTGEEANSWGATAWSPALSLFVAVAIGGTHRVMTSPDGLAWTPRTAAEANSWSAVCWSPELAIFVAVAASGTNRVMTSTDGINWTARSAAETNGWRDVIWVSTLGLFVSVANNGTNRIMTSPDGITWTARAAAEANNWAAITWDAANGYLVVVGNTGTHRSMRSDNGTNWTVSTTTPSKFWLDVEYSPALEILVAVGGTNGSDQIVMYSTDGGDTWTEGTAAPGGTGTYNISSVVWNSIEAKFVILPANVGGGAKILYSDDGINWQDSNLVSSNAFSISHSACYSPDLNTIVGCAGINMVKIDFITSIPYFNPYQVDGRYLVKEDATGYVLTMRNKFVDITDGGATVTPSVDFAEDDLVALSADTALTSSGKAIVRNVGDVITVVADGDKDTAPTAGITVRQTANDVRIKGLTIQSVLPAWFYVGDPEPSDYLPPYSAAGSFDIATDPGKFVPAAYFPEFNLNKTILEDVQFIGTATPLDGGGSWPMRVGGGTDYHNGTYRNITGRGLICMGLGNGGKLIDSELTGCLRVTTGSRIINSTILGSDAYDHAYETVPKFTGGYSIDSDTGSVTVNVSGCTLSRGTSLNVTNSIELPYNIVDVDLEETPVT